MTAVATRSRHVPQYNGSPKVCNRCGAKHPRRERWWNKNSNYMDGLNGACKTCERAYKLSKKREYAAKRGPKPPRIGGGMHDVAELLHRATMNTEDIAAYLGTGRNNVNQMIRRLKLAGVPVEIVGETEAWDYSGHGKAVPVYRILYPSGRQCPDCGAYLNRYNAGPNCGAHTREIA